jgi:predicted O-methyltransferase YrrM
MNDRLPDNLALLYDGFGKEAIDTILPGESFDVSGVEFVCKYLPESTADRFFIVKSLPLVERYRQLCDQFKGGSIFELGIAEGGSTALMALLAEPRRLVAVDLEREPLAALDEFIGRRSLGDVVRPHYGVDQADREHLGAVAEAELGGEPIDLVIDDCSHQLAETRSSFETLFPRLRPGGLFVIEDWNGDHVMYDAVRRAIRDPSSPGHVDAVEQFRQAMTNPAETMERRAPLLQLAVELLLVRASLGDAIRSVTIDEFWVTVERGADELDPTTFRVSDHCHDYYGLLPGS